MNRNSTPALLLPLAAILAVAFPFAFNLQQTAPTPGRQATQPKLSFSHSSPSTDTDNPSRPQPPVVHDANAILTDFFAVKDLHQLFAAGNDSRVAYDIHFMIATIPDPVDSRLPYLFDRFLASIQRAAEADHFVLDRFDLPWIEELQKARDRSESSSSYLTEPAAVHPHNTEPGFLLFRDSHSAGGPRLLLLFVVGEIPSAGIHKAALISALNQIVQLRKTFDLVDAPIIPILGPSFSGSAESLDFALESWLAARRLSPGLQAPVQFQIVTGSATAIPTETKQADNGWWYFSMPPDKRIAEFQSTVALDSVGLSTFLDFLWDRRLPPNRPTTVALLTEANTAYGASMNAALKAHSRPRPSANKSRAEFPCVPVPSAQRKDDSSDVARSVHPVGLPFPLHISRLRSESEKTRRAREQTSQQVNTPTASSRYLPLPLDDETDTAKDSIPPVSDLDISSSELVLENLLSTISHEQFDYVGIAATDVRDTIFLAREIRQHSPSSVIFSLNADLIYIHPEANPNTRGMLVVTPYPLFTLNQRWTDPPELRGNRLQFPDQNSEGVYNAMRLLLHKSLGDPLALLEYRVPFDPSSGLSPHLPPIWITTVGRWGFWPVAVIAPAADDNYMYCEQGSLQPNVSDVTSELPRGMIPHSAILVYFCWGLLCLLPSLVFLRPYAQQRFPNNKFFARDLGLPSLDLFRDPAFSRNRGECRAYSLVGGIASVAAYVIAVTAYAITHLPGPQGPSYWLAVALMLAVMILCFAACLLLMTDTVSLARGMGGQSSNGWLAYPVLSICVIVLSLAAWLAVDWLILLNPAGPSLSRAANRIVTGFRALNLVSGASPLPPLFLIALAADVWACSAVRRVHLTESLPWIHPSECRGLSDSPADTNKCALFNSSSASFRGFQALESEVQALLRCPSLHLPGEGRALSFVVAGIIVIASIYLFYGRLVVALELPSFYFLFGICFMLVYLSIAFNILRLLFLWLALRKLLQALNRHPIRAAFARFHRSFPNLPRISLAAAPSPMTALNFSIQQGAALLRSAKSLLPAKSNLVCAASSAKPHIDDAETCYREALDSETLRDRCKSLMAQLGAQSFLAQASRLVEESLERAWSAGPASPTPDPSIEEKREKLVQEAEEFLVGRTVLFLSHVFPQMTNLAGLSLASLLLLLLAVSCYPFQPHQLIFIFIWLLIFAFVTVALYMSVQMNRDTLLSNLNGSKPGEINWDREFVARIFIYVVVPILGFLGVQFPDAIAQIFSFLSPGAAGHG